MSQLPTIVWFLGAVVFVVAAYFLVTKLWLPAVSRYQADLKESEGKSVTALHRYFLVPSLLTIALLVGTWVALAPGEPRNDTAVRHATGTEPNAAFREAVEADRAALKPTTREELEAERAAERAAQPVEDAARINTQAANAAKGYQDFRKAILEGSRIEAAQKRRVRKEIEVETERSEGRKLAAREEADLARAQIRAARELLEAQSIADQNRIIGSSIPPQYLAYKQIEAQKLAAGGANNMFFVPYSDTVNGSIDFSKWTKAQGVVDAELLTRIQDARRRLEALNAAEDEAEAAKEAKREAAKAKKPAPKPKK